jgi:hypothetical protein
VFVLDDCGRLAGVSVERCPAGGGKSIAGAGAVEHVNPFERLPQRRFVRWKLSVARGGAIGYLKHALFSSGPRFAPGAFCFWNCCCGRLSCRRRVESLLDECLLDAVTNLGVHRTPRRLCGRLNVAAQLFVKADIEPRWLLSIVRMHGRLLQCRGGIVEIRPIRVAR